MPVILHRTPSADTVLEDVDARLHDATGALTLEGQVIMAFLESVNFDDLLDDADLSEFVEAVEKKKKAKKKDDAEDGDDEGTEDMEEGEVYTTLTMEGEDLAEFLDEEDMAGMFEFFVGQMPATTVEEKVLKAAGERLLGIVEDREDDVLEAAKEGDEGVTKLDEAKGAFKKGDFVKIRKGKLKTSTGKTGLLLVQRMLGAIEKKGAIKRTEKGGYHAPGGAGVATYKKDAGYGSGSVGGKKAYAKFIASGKGKSAKLKAKTKVKGAAAAEMKAKAKENAAKAKAKASRLEKKKPGAVTGAKKKSLVAHDDTTRSDRMDESLSLAGSVIAGMNKSGSGKPTAKTITG